jgi:hypothetical protein
MEPCRPRWYGVKHQLSRGRRSSATQATVRENTTLPQQKAHTPDFRKSLANHSYKLVVTVSVFLAVGFSHARHLNSNRT